MTIHPWALAVLLLTLPTAATASSKSAPTPTPGVLREATRLLAQTYPDDGPGGAVLVARGDTVLFRDARGLADLGTHAPLRPDAVFRIGSLTKQFAAAGLLTLVDAGKVSLDDPLSKYVPDFPGGERISVAQLLDHTAGV